MEKMLLIDGNSLLFRSYYATAIPGKPILCSKSGIPTNALMGLANMSFKIIDLIKPKYSIVAWDTDKPTFRHQSSTEYKANRKAPPEELIQQMEPARKMLNLFGLNCLELGGYEADDIIGTFATLASKKDIEVIIFSADRDLLQLINDKVKVYLTLKGVSNIKIMDEKALMEEYQLTPNQIPDFKGLMGDPSDNIKGIDGIGPKTAVKLLQTYGNMENLIRNVEQLEGKLKERIMTGSEIGLISKELATIYTNVPVDCNLEKYIFSYDQFPELEKFFLSLDMVNLARKTATTNSQSSQNIELKDVDISYQVVSVMPKDLDDKVVISAVYDQENYHLSNVIGVVISSNNGNYFIEKNNLLKDAHFIAYLQGNNPKYGFNIKATIVALNKLGIEINNFIFDFYLGAYLLNSSLKNDPAVIFNEFGYSITYMDIVFKKSNDVNSLINYFSKIVNYTLLLIDEMQNKLEQCQMTKLFLEIEVPLASILARMEIYGVKVDVEILEELNINYKNHLEILKEKIYKYSGKVFNVDSPKQLAEILFDHLGLPSNKKRSTGVEILEYLSQEHPIVPYIMEYRKYSKLINTYTEGLKNYIFLDQKFHTIYNQTSTTTGRLSSTSPNLQQIAVKDENQRQIRRAFIPNEKNYYLLSIDYSQIELRILASLANSHEMINAFNCDQDIHSETASKIFNVPLIAVTSEMRRKAKAVNFGIIYGMSNFGLSETIKISQADAKEFIKVYFEKYPTIKEYLEQSVAEAKKNGYATTIFNRRRYIKELNDNNFMIRELGKRLAMNSPIQGSAADIMKKAMINCHNFIGENKLKSIMIMQIHDELIFEVPADELDIMTTKLVEVIENCVDIGVKLKCDYGYGINWYNAK